MQTETKPLQPPLTFLVFLFTVSTVSATCIVNNASGFYLAYGLSFVFVLAHGLDEVRYTLINKRLSPVQAFHAKTRRFSRKHSRRIQLSRSKSKYCWTKYFPDLITPDVAYSFGPVITRRTFDKLLALYNCKTLHIARSSLALHNCHVYVTTGPMAGTMDRSPYLGTPQTTIDVAASVNAAILGTPTAGEIFRESVKHSLVVSTAVTKEQRATLEGIVDFPVIFKNIVPVAHDHAVVAACRELIRQIYETCSKVSRTKVPTVAVGASSHEFTKYSANRAIDYYFHDAESKDYTRTVKWFLESFVENLAKKCGHGSKFTTRDKDGVMRKRYESFKAMLKDYREFMKIPDCLLTELRDGYEQVLLEDSFYNFKPEDYRDLFTRTGANVANGYGLLPLEMIFPDMPQNKLYRLTREGGKLHLNFSYSNGYCHDEEAWSTLLRSPVMRFSDFCLVVEIVSFVGPMAVFRINKVVETGETVSRTIALPEKKKFVRILDLLASTDENGAVRSLSYISVFAYEYFTALNYCLSIDPKSLTLQNTMTFVRRRSGGVTLISSHLIPAWHLNERDCHAFSLTVYLVAKRIIQRTEKIDALQSTGGPRNLYDLLVSRTRNPFSVLSHFVSKNALSDKLVIFPDSSLKQREQIIISDPVSINYELKLEEVFEEKYFDCPICGKLDGKLGDQIIECEHKNHSVTISMSEDDLKVMAAKLADDDNDPPGLANVKKRAKNAMPKTAFEHTCRFHYIMGGPGCGKSFIIRQLANAFDLVYAPFTKLMPDYQGVIDKLGNKVDLNFATVHRGLEARGVSTIYIDEFTSLPMEYIKMVIAVNKAEDVFIVGDSSQSRVQANEGTYIGDVIDLDTLPRHTLLRNFRNPVDVVNLLNTKHGYKMEAMSSVKKSITILGPDEQLPEDLKKLVFNKFTFCYASLAAYSLTQDDTVRKYQGSTVDNAMLFVDKDSTEETSGSNLSIVALSRHKKNLVVKHDGSARATAWLVANGLIGELSTEPGVKHEKKDSCPPLDFSQKEAQNFVETRFVRSELPKPKETGPVLNRYFRDRFNFSRTIPLVLKFSFSRVFLINTLVYLGFDLFSAFSGRTSESELMLSIVFLVCRFNILKAGMLAVSSAGANADVHVLLYYFLLSYPFKANPRMFHYVADFLPSFLSGLSVHTFLVLPYISAKLVYISRLLSISSERPSRKILFIAVLAAFGMFALKPFGNDHFCDFLSRPYVVALVLLLRWLNVRTSWSYPFFSYDPVDQTKIWDYEYYVNTLRESYQEGPEFVEYMYHYLPLAPSFLTKLEPSKELEPVKPKEQAGKDSYLLVGDLVPPAGQEELVEFHNNVASSLAPDDYYTGVVSEDFLNPLTVKHKPANTMSEFFQFLPGTGATFLKKSLPQLLQVMGSRYFNKKPKSLRPFDHNAKLVAKDVVDVFFMECMDEPHFEEEDVSVIAGEFSDSARKKKYESMFKGFDNFDAKTIRFHLKDILKPKVGAIQDPHKPGQGISAWSKDAQVMFGIGARLANYWLCKYTKANVVYDNRMSTEDMKAKVTSLMASVPKTSLNGITDFTMFDSQQDQFTQEIEKCFLRRLGFSDEFIEHYYMFRSNYKMIGGPLAGTCRYEKTSGEPMTLLMNTIISGCLSNYFLRGEGKFMLAMKGDDGFKRQAQLKIDEHRYSMVSQYTCLRMKVDIGNEAEFCGYVIVGGIFVDSVFRKLHKALSHHFKSYSHFCLYQQSLRDFVQSFESDDFFYEYLVANAKIYKKLGFSITEVQAAYDAVKSISHMNEDQFYDSVCRVKFDNIYYTARGGPLIQYFDRKSGSVWRSFDE